MLGQLAAGTDLSLEEMSDAIDAIMQGRCTEGEIGLLLTGLRFKGETVAEIAGAATAMRRHMVRIRTSRSGVIDTCGPGGVHSGTFNISTAAALVTAAAGVPVAKHGNRRVTSKTGSADALAALGVNIQADVPTVEACLDQLGICFCFAPLMHPAMKQVAAVRQKLGMPTIFNLLGPLTNPAGARFQLLGVGQPDLRPKLAAALQLLGSERALVVGGDDGLGEVTLTGTTQGIEVSPGRLAEFTWQPEDFGLPPASLTPLLVETPEQSAAAIRGVLGGEIGPRRDIVVLNAAAAILTARPQSTPHAAATVAATAIDSGAALELLNKLVDLSYA